MIVVCSLRYLQCDLKRLDMRDNKAHQLPILIVGGGIGGLTLALTLSRHGIKSHILEAREVFSEVGAGIQLGPNAGRILARLGLMDDIAKRASAPKEIRIRSAETGGDLATLPLIPYMEERFFAPYLTMRRVDLQSVLLEHVLGDDAITVSNGFKLEKTRSSLGDITAISEKGDEISGAALVGSDGIWSVTREIVAPGHPLNFSGKTAWRTLIPNSDLPNGIDADKIGLWLGDNAHLVHYPVGGDSDEINIVAVIDDQTEDRHWSQAAEKSEIEAHYDKWAPAAKMLIKSATTWRKWSLYTTKPLANWHQGRICLLGDAAHPVLPFLAQGGVLAIEDAFILADCINDNDDDIDLAFSVYETQREPRASRVQSRSQKNGTIYHMKKPISVARDLVLKNSSATSLIGRYDWLYGYDVKNSVL